MAGKPYNIKEMKLIVDFIIENKAYGEIKGRKKWMDLANSKLTTRTWQSLKETFIKRILPDIHNPYYKLTALQVRSFREGRDIPSQEKNKLKIISNSDDSSSNVDNHEDIQTSKSKNATKGNEENPSGETIKSANVRSNSRSSVETLVLDSEERDEHLDGNDEAEAVSGKSIRDFITYSEPLTPMMQDIMEDFTSDEDNRLLIDEVAPSDNSETTNSKIIENNKNTATIEKSQTEDLQINVEKESNFKKPLLLEEKENLKEKKSLSPQSLALTQNKACDDGKESQTQQNTNTSTDTTIPNNQESLASKVAKLRESVEKVEENKNLNNETSRKRAISHSSEEPKSKKQMSNKVKESKNPKTDPPSTQDSATIENPCLKSVSLYAEEFTPTNYLNSESSDTDEDSIKIVENNKNTIKVNKDIMEDSIVLKSHSESDKEDQQLPNTQAYKIKQKQRKHTRISTEKKLANVFGFSSVAVQKKIRHNSVHKRSPQRYRHKYESSELSSSDWTSESDGEYISPPRNGKSKSKYPKKYLKPKSLRVVSLEEEGGLFVMYGKKLFPVVKDGKIIKNYVNYLADEDREEVEESYWRDKFIEEKKKTLELTKLLNNAKDSNQIVPEIEELPSVSNPEGSSRIPSVQYKPETTENPVISNKNVETSTSLQQTNKTVKIKFTKKDEEVQLEGHWSQLEPVLQQVVGYLHKEDKPPTKDPETSAKRAKTSAMERKPSEVSTVDIISSGSITPSADEATQLKVDILEKTIFKQIESLDKADKSMEMVNVTSRRPKPVKSSEVPSDRPSLRVSEVSNEHNNSTVEPNNKDQDGERNVSNENVPKVQKRTYKKRAWKSEMSKTFRDSTPRKSKRLENHLESNDDEDSQILYKFPSPPPSSRKLDKNTDTNKVPSNKYNVKARVISRGLAEISSPDSILQRSIESSQGYQDSDNSVQLYRLKRKRKHGSSSVATVSASRNKFKVKTRRKLNSLVVDNSSDSSNVHQSDSYQLLLPKRRSLRPLESIDEVKPITTKNEADLSGVHSNSNSSTGDSIIITAHNEEPNSSNVYLPLSPELSIVENISINKSSLSNKDDLTTINETQNNRMELSSNNNKYAITQVDATMPLENINNSKAASLEHKCNSVDLSEITSPPDGLHKKLHDLILDSAKKLLHPVSSNAMEIDSTHVELPPKKNAKSRCSTPRKKSDVQKPPKRKITKKEPVIEESVQYCMNGGRNSCPPTIVAHFENSKSEEVNIDSTNKKTGKTQKRKPKKDVIKVKILRPRSKSPRISKSKSNHKDSSTGLRSGKINTGTQNDESESGIFLHSENDSVDLIHNHSETCLLANECVDNSSVEFVTTHNSPILIDSESMKINEELFYDSVPDCANLTPDMFCNNAQDESHFKRSKSMEPDTQQSKNDLTLNTPIASEISSLITEDLSNESPSPKRSKWYLLSEDETNTVLVSENNKNGSQGLTGNLKQLFPIVCAVPNLSTITESSKDNDSRKHVFNTIESNNNDK